MARDTGWSLAAAAAPASCSSRAAVTSPVATTSATRIWPVVTVPVLSSTIVVTRRVCSSTSGPLISTPSWAPRPVPTSSAVGVARPSAHGQATTSTATAAPKASAAPAPSSSQKASAAPDSAITIGTNTAETRSASRWASALPLWAAVTMRPMRATAVSAPTAVARTTSRPSPFTVEPVTLSPGATSTGTLSPVRSERSTPETPCSTSPSVAMRSPGRTTKVSPTTSCAVGTRRSGPSTSSVASGAPSSSSARSAAPAWRFARASKKRPVSTRVVTTAATSRYRSSPGEPPVCSDQSIDMR